MLADLSAVNRHTKQDHLADYRAVYQPSHHAETVRWLGQPGLSSPYWHRIHNAHQYS